MWTVNLMSFSLFVLFFYLHPFLGFYQSVVILFILHEAVLSCAADVEQSQKQSHLTCPYQVTLTSY